MRKIIPLLAVLAALASCQSTTPPPPSATASPVAATTSSPVTTHAFLGAHGFDLAGMDPTAKACDSFYQYSVGNWRATHALPAQYSRFGRFEELAERNRDTLRTILEEDAAMTNAPAGSNAQKLGDFYGACMNETAVEAAGSTPIQPIDFLVACRDHDNRDRTGLA